MESQNPANFPGPEPEVVERQSCQKASGERSPSWTAQNETRGVLSRLTEGAA